MTRAEQRLAAIRRATTRKQTATNDWRRTIRQADKAGVSKTAIAEAAGISRPTLYLLLSKEKERR